MSDRSDARELLRAAAAAHQPDRERMLAHVERGTRGTRRTRPAAGRWTVIGRAVGLPGWARVAGAAAALAVTLGAGALAVSWVAGGPQDPAEASPTGGQTGGGGGPVPADVHATAEVDKGSNPYWSQSDVTVTTQAPLTSFTIELHIAKGEGVRPTGAWRTLPEDDFDLTMETRGEELVFRWELHEDTRIPAGEHVFAGQYDHDAGPRDAAADWYRVRGAGPGGEVSARGGFV
jgi:hypothetical protein